MTKSEIVVGENFDFTGISPGERSQFSPVYWAKGNSELVRDVETKLLSCGKSVRTVELVVAKKKLTRVVSLVEV